MPVNASVLLRCPLGRSIFEAGYFYHFGRVPILQENPKLSTFPSSFFITSIQSAGTQKWDLQKQEHFRKEQFSYVFRAAGFALLQNTLRALHVERGILQREDVIEYQ